MTEQPPGPNEPERGGEGWIPQPPPSREPEQHSTWPFEDRGSGQQPQQPQPSPWARDQGGYGSQYGQYTYPAQPQSPQYTYSQPADPPRRRRGSLAALGILIAAIVGGGAGAAIEHNWGDN